MAPIPQRWPSGIFYPSLPLPIPLTHPQAPLHLPLLIRYLQGSLQSHTSKDGLSSQKKALFLPDSLPRTIVWSPREPSLLSWDKLRVLSSFLLRTMALMYLPEVQFLRSLLVFLSYHLGLLSSFIPCLSRPTPSTALQLTPAQSNCCPLPHR